MKLTRIFLSLLFVLFATSTLQAKPSDPVPKDKVPFIQAVQVDFAANVGCPGEDSQATDTLTIRGVGFGLADGPSPVITLGQNIDDLLTVCFFSDEEVVAELPVDTEDGDYLLSIVTAGGVGGFDLTIGAVGPAGADGAAGATGPAGPDGAVGAQSARAAGTTGRASIYSNL